MSDENDAFGAGLDLGAVGTDGTSAGAASVNDDPWLEQTREIFEGLPPDATRETFQNYILEIQEKAAKAEEAESRARQFEAQLASQMSSLQTSAAQATTAPAAATATPATAAAEARAEAKRQYEAAAKVDPLLQPYLGGKFSQVDEYGRYVPTEEFKYQPTVSKACEAMNAQLEHQRRVLNDMTNDPYQFTNETVRHTDFAREMQERYEALQKKFDEQQKAFDERFKPLQQSAQEQALTAMMTQHHALLTVPKPGSTSGEREWSPAGNMFNNLVNGGMEPQKALELVQPLAGLQAPPPPKTKKNPAAQGQFSLTRRMTNGVALVPEQNGLGRGEGKQRFRTRLKDLPPPLSLDDE